jgi:hypothetical protein
MESHVTTGEPPSPAAGGCWRPSHYIVLIIIDQILSSMTYMMYRARQFHPHDAHVYGIRLADTREGRLMYTNSNHLKEMSRGVAELIEALFIGFPRLMHRRPVGGRHLPEPGLKGRSDFMSG